MRPLSNSLGDRRTNTGKTKKIWKQVESNHKTEEHRLSAAKNVHLITIKKPIRPVIIERKSQDNNKQQKDHEIR